MEALNGFDFAVSNPTETDFLKDDHVIQLGVPPMRIDILTFLSGMDWDTAVLHKVSAKFDDIPVYVIGQEDFILNKRASGRSSRRPHEHLCRQAVVARRGRQGRSGPLDRHRRASVRLGGGALTLADLSDPTGIARFVRTTPQLSRDIKVGDVLEIVGVTSAGRLVPDGPFTAEIQMLNPAAWNAGKLIDAEVMLRGCLSPFYNQRAEFLGIRLHVSGTNAIAVLKPAPADPFDLPVTPLDGTLVQLRAGAAIEAAGFPAMGNSFAELNAAHLRLGSPRGGHLRNNSHKSHFELHFFF